MLPTPWQPSPVSLLIILQKLGIVAQPLCIVTDGAADTLALFHKLVRDVLTLIIHNTRDPESRLLDIKAQYAGTFVGEQRIIALVKKYGKRNLHAAMAQSLDYSERLMRANFAFVTPTTHLGETVTRFAIVNPRTTEGDISAILDTMA